MLRETCWRTLPCDSSNCRLLPGHKNKRLFSVRSTKPVGASLSIKCPVEALLIVLRQAVERCHPVLTHTSHWCSAFPAGQHHRRIRVLLSMSLILKARWWVNADGQREEPRKMKASQGYIHFKAVFWRGGGGGCADLHVFSVWQHVHNTAHWLGHYQEQAPSHLWCLHWLYWLPWRRFVPLQQGLISKRRHSCSCFYFSVCLLRMNNHARVQLQHWTVLMVFMICLSGTD